MQFNLALFLLLIVSPVIHQNNGLPLNKSVDDDDLIEELKSIALAMITDLAIQVEARWNETNLRLLEKCIDDLSQEYRSKINEEIQKSTLKLEEIVYRFQNDSSVLECVGSYQVQLQEIAFNTNELLSGETINFAQEFFEDFHVAAADLIMIVHDVLDAVEKIHDYESYYEAVSAIERQQDFPDRFISFVKQYLNKKSLEQHCVQAGIEMQTYCYGEISKIESITKKMQQCVN